MPLMDMAGGLAREDCKTRGLGLSRNSILYLSLFSLQLVVVLLLCLLLFLHTCLATLSLTQINQVIYCK